MSPSLRSCLGERLASAEVQRDGACVQCRQVQQARAPAAGGGAAREWMVYPARAAAEPARAAEQRGKSSGGPPPTCCSSWGSGSGIRRISRSRASRPCMGPFEVFDSAVGNWHSYTLRRQRRLREGGKLHDEYEVTTTTRHRDIMMTDRAARIRLSCLAPRARDLTGGLVRGPVQLLARPAAVLYALARTALGAGAVGAARARAAAALASPGRACARTRGSGARRRAALSRAGRKRDGLRRDRHCRGVGK
jgi:hypothetical protein